MMDLKKNFSVVLSFWGSIPHLDSEGYLLFGCHICWQHEGTEKKESWHTKKATPKGSPICGGGHAAPTVRPLGMYLHQLLPYPHYITSPASMV
jgi:hypothetical protein